MSIEEISKLMDQYWVWLRDKTKLREVEKHIEITTPYLDRHNDRIQIYAIKANDGFTLTDDGYIIQDLQSSGCELTSTKRRGLLETTLKGFGVTLENDALVMKATTDTFAHKKHNLVQAMLAVNDMFYLASPMVSSLFHEDAASWLETNDIRYTSGAKFSGKSGLDHLFDFVIPKSRKQPERIIQAINHPSKTTAMTTVMAWFDTKNVRPPNSKAYALLNDSENEASPSVIVALKSYGVHPILWSKREDAKEELAA